MSTGARLWLRCRLFLPLPLACQVALQAKAVGNTFTRIIVVKTASLKCAFTSMASIHFIRIPIDPKSPSVLRQLHPDGYRGDAGLVNEEEHVPPRWRDVVVRRYGRLPLSLRSGPTQPYRRKAEGCHLSPWRFLHPGSPTRTSWVYSESHLP